MQRSALVLPEAPRASGLTPLHVGSLATILCRRFDGTIYFNDRDIDLELTCPFCGGSPAFFSLRCGEFQCLACDNLLHTDWLYDDDETEENGFLEHFDLTFDELDRLTISRGELNELVKALRRDDDHQRARARSCDGARISYTLPFNHPGHLETDSPPTTRLHLKLGVFWCATFSYHFAPCHHFGSARELATLIGRGAASPTT